MLEGEPPGRLAALGVDDAELSAADPALDLGVGHAVRARRHRARDEPATDLTLLAGGGPVWSCGYDDHTLPPVRGGGNQAFHIGQHLGRDVGRSPRSCTRDATGAASSST